MKVIDSKWPFIPLHITNDGEKSFFSTEKEKINLNGVGIIPNAHLQGLETNICANLKSPTTIIEFSQDGYSAKTDSPLLYSSEPPFGLIPPCRLLRQYAGEKYCFKCDSIHAELFYGLDEETLVDTVNKRICRSEYINAYKNNDDTYFNFEEESDRVYIEYDCPLLGYREIIFPIYFNKKVIAVFFTGQICLASQKDNISKKIKKFLDSNANCFEIYSLKNNIPINNLQKEIIVAHENWIKDAKHVLSVDSYNQLIITSINEIVGLEKTLNDQMNLQRQVYIRKQIDTIIKRFRDSPIPLNLDGAGMFDLLWSNIKISLEDIVEQFKIKYVIVFSANRFSQEQSNLLDVVVNVGKLPAKLKKTIDNCSLNFNLNKLSKNTYNKWITSYEDATISDAITGWDEFDHQYNLIRIFPVPLFPQLSLVVLVGYYKENPLFSIENQPRGELSIALQSFYTIVLSTLSYVAAGTVKNIHENVLSKLTHELKSPLVAIRGAVETMQIVPGIKKRFDYDYLGDIWSWSELMGRLIENADVFRYAKESIILQPIRVNLLRDIIAAPIRQAKILLEERNFPIHNIEYDKSELLSFPKLYLDRNRFQQVIFNLISNSVKYAYKDRTAFHVEILGDPDNLHLKYRDWGPGIREEEKELIFEEGYRGDDAIDMYISGRGIGLWICKKIIESHGGTIEVTNIKHPLEFTISLSEEILVPPKFRRSWNG